MPNYNLLECEHSKDHDDCRFCSHYKFDSVQYRICLECLNSVLEYDGFCKKCNKFSLKIRRDKYED